MHSRGSTSAIELSAWNERLDQPTGLRRDRRADMRLANRTLRVTWGTGADDDAEAKLGIFAALYHKLIDRNGAESFYRFPQEVLSKADKARKKIGHSARLV